MVEAQTTLEALGYLDSPNFLRKGTEEFEYATDYGHVFRKAAREDGCRLQGVYALRQPTPGSAQPVVPVVYVCHAESAEEADTIHRLVWNQDVVPFLVVETRHNVRFYSGFRHQPHKRASRARGVLHAAIEFNLIADVLEALRAEAVDDGSVWQQWGREVTPKTRVDWQLVDSLQKLDAWLQAHGLDVDPSHALIGKYVYLHYLRDRGILGPLLKEWGLDPTEVFQRTAQVDVFWQLMDRLDDWPNGAVFPVSENSRAQIEQRHVETVAGVFSGDDPSGQLSLPFEAYEFSHIPIETLSVVYENFLHTPRKQGGRTKGKESGAYYTPIPLVNLMLDELHEKRPLREGMKVLDPSCGSAAFLVQCYRRLVEQHLRTLRRERECGARPRLAKLRDLLVGHIFGVERDKDACRVARLSLTLALLDYVDPPELVQSRNFKLPDLGKANIFEADFFEPGTEWSRFAERTKFDWIAGNPPWISIDGEDLKPEDEHVWEWMRGHGEDSPVGNNQVAEAFAWKATDHLERDGVIGLLLPAMTLFNDSSRRMRARFFSRMLVWCVANFANLRHVLFGGRAVGPAAALFYRLSKPRNGRSEDITVFSPFLANQGCRTTGRARAPREAWSIAVNAGEIRWVESPDAASGHMLPWKAAMWGTRRDQQLIERVRERCAAFGTFASRHCLAVRQGLPLRTADAEEEVEFEEELQGKCRVEFERLRDCKRIFGFPRDAIVPIPDSMCYLRKRSGKAGLAIFRGPHIVVDSALRFAVYSDEYLAVPPKPIGIAGGPEEEDVLRALSLYLSSDFAAYYLFMTSPEWGVRSPRGTLRSLRGLPVPLDRLTARETAQWTRLHRSIVTAEKRGGGQLAPLVARMNENVFDLLDLRPSERDLVRELVDVRLDMIDGKIGTRVVSAPEKTDLEAYLITLRDDLDQFVAGQKGSRHRLEAVYDTQGALICTELIRDARRAIPVRVRQTDGRLRRELGGIPTNLREQHSQWVYFERNLRIYDGLRTYLFKPMQRVHWPKTQAYEDAGEIIAEVLTGAEG